MMKKLLLVVICAVLIPRIPAPAMRQYQGTETGVSFSYPGVWSVENIDYLEVLQNTFGIAWPAEYPLPPLDYARFYKPGVFGIDTNSTMLFVCAQMPAGVQAQQPGRSQKEKVENVTSDFAMAIAGFNNSAAIVDENVQVIEDIAWADVTIRNGDARNHTYRKIIFSMEKDTFIAFVLFLDYETPKDIWAAQKAYEHPDLAALQAQSDAVMPQILDSLQINPAKPLVVPGFLGRAL